MFSPQRVFSVPFGPSSIGEGMSSASRGIKRSTPMSNCGSQVPRFRSAGPRIPRARRPNASPSRFTERKRARTDLPPEPMRVDTPSPRKRQCAPTSAQRRPCKRAAPTRFPCAGEKHIREEDDLRAASATPSQKRRRTQPVEREESHMGRAQGMSSAQPLEDLTRQMGWRDLPHEEALHEPEETVHEINIAQQYENGSGGAEESTQRVQPSVQAALLDDGRCAVRIVRADGSVQGVIIDAP